MGEELNAVQLAKTPAESKTIRTANRVQIGAAIAALLPDIIGLCVDLLGNDVVGGMIQQAVPPQYRLLIGVIVIAVVQRFRNLRYQTSEPIQRDQKEQK